MSCMKVVAIDQREFSKVHTCKIIYLVKEFIKKNDIKEAHEYDLISDKRGASMKFKTQCFFISAPSFFHSRGSYVDPLYHLHSSLFSLDQDRKN